MQVILPQFHQVRETEHARFLRRETGHASLFVYYHTLYKTWGIAKWLSPGQTFTDIGHLEVEADGTPYLTKDEIAHVKDHFRPRNLAAERDLMGRARMEQDEAWFRQQTTFRAAQKANRKAMRGRRDDHPAYQGGDTVKV